MVPVRSIGRSWEIAGDAALCAGRAPRPVLDNDLESAAGCRFAQVGLADAGSQWFRRREFRRGGGASFMGNSGASRITGTENLYDNFRHLISPIAQQPEMRSPLTLGRAEMASGRLSAPRPRIRVVGLDAAGLAVGSARLGSARRLRPGAPCPLGPQARRVRRVRRRHGRPARRDDPRKGVMTRLAVPGKFTSQRKVEDGYVPAPVPRRGGIAAREG
jgi:hypothetical protein